MFCRNSCFFVVNKNGRKILRFSETTLRTCRRKNVSYNPTSNIVNPRRVVAHELAQAALAQVLARRHRLDGVEKFAVTMVVVGSKNQPVFADVIHDEIQRMFIGSNE
jgi:hypothetical protein